MKELLEYVDWLVRMIFVLLSFFAFQSSIIAVSANPIILDQSHHIGISEIYIYDETENSVGANGDRTNGLSRVLSVKEVRPGHEVLVGESSGAAKGVTTALKPLGLGSTGRSVAKNLTEQLAMKEIMSNPTTPSQKVLMDLQPSLVNGQRW